MEKVLILVWRGKSWKEGAVLYPLDLKRAAGEQHYKTNAKITLFSFFQRPTTYLAQSVLHQLDLLSLH